MDELRRTGLDKMNEVYAWDMPDMPGEFFALTVDHLFGRIWTRPGLSMRDRRMAVIAVLTAQGQSDLLEVQVNAVHYPLCRLPAGLAAEQCDRAGSGQA